MEKLIKKRDEFYPGTSTQVNSRGATRKAPACPGAPVLVRAWTWLSPGHGRGHNPVTAAPQLFHPYIIYNYRAVTCSDVDFTSSTGLRNFLTAFTCLKKDLKHRGKMKLQSHATQHAGTTVPCNISPCHVTPAATPCRAMPSVAKPCNAMPCSIYLCKATCHTAQHSLMQSHAMQSHPMQCQPLQCHATHAVQCCACNMQRNTAKPCNATPSHAMPTAAKPCSTSPPHATQCPLLQSHAMQCLPLAPPSFLNTFRSSELMGPRKQHCRQQDPFLAMHRQEAQCAELNRLQIYI